MSKVILAYIPVLHQGYYQLFSSHPKVKTLYVLSNAVARQFTPVHKELRALHPSQIISAIKSWNLFSLVVSADVTELKDLDSQKLNVIIPDEIVTSAVAETYLPNCQITKSTIFLRWDTDSAIQKHPPLPGSTVTFDQAAQTFMQRALAEGIKSSDWWRQVGAIAVRNGHIIAQAHNTHLPSEQQPYSEGDPRAHFHKGDHFELTTAIHAEAKLVAEAAQKGISLQDAELFVTDFPCPTCAKLIAHAGFTKLYFAKGYSLLDGERVLKSKNIELIQVTQ